MPRVPNAVSVLAGRRASAPAPAAPGRRRGPDGSLATKAHDLRACGESRTPARSPLRARSSSLVALLLTGVLAAPAGATVIVGLSPAATSVAAGAGLDLELRADLSADAVAGFGLDLVFDSSVLDLEGVVIGPDWEPAFAPDGDGLVALAPLTGAPTGADVLLATVSLRAIGVGETVVSVSATAGDLTEGFPLLSPPGAFADFTSGTALVEVPEPGTALLALLALLAGLLVPGMARSQEGPLPTPSCGNGGDGALFEGIGDPDPDRFSDAPVGISRDGRWLVGNADNFGSFSRGFRYDAESRSFTRIWSGFYGSADVHASDVSDDGLVVGTLGNGHGAFVHPGTFFELLCDEPRVDCDALFSGTPRGDAISADGGTTAGLTDAPEPTAYKWSPTTGVTLLDPLPFRLRSIRAMTADGHRVVGEAEEILVIGSSGFNITRAVVWEGTQPTLLPSLPGCVARGRVAGGEFVEVPVDCGMEAVDVSADGAIVVGHARVFSSDRSCGNELVRWREGALEPLGCFATGSSRPSSLAAAVSDDGTLIAGNAGVQGFVWDESHGFRSVAAFLADQGVTGFEDWTRLGVQDVRTTPTGAIAMTGEGRNPEGDEEIWRAVVPCLDADVDGLCDAWERAGGIDLDGDGAILPGADVLLPDANPAYKDLYIEVDSMDGAAVDPATLVPVELAFNNVPSNLIPNPSGSGGIELHFIFDEVGIADRFGASDSIGTSCDPAQGTSEIDALAALHMGTAVERQNPTLLAAKKQVYRYALWAPALDNGAGGRATIDGAILVVTPQSKAESTAAAFMHELGHSLGLRHGGPGDDTNYKPNYKSVMNYLWSYRGDIPTNDPPAAVKAYASSWRLDFSRVPYATLAETGLDESAGLGGDPRSFVPIGPRLPQVEYEVGAIDYDRDGTIDPDPVQANLNWIVGPDAGSSSELLVGTADWPFVGQNLCEGFRKATFQAFRFRGSCESAPSVSTAALAEGEEPQFVIPDEITPEIRAELSSVDYIDCNRNGVVDDEDLAAGIDVDLDDDGILDGCEPLAGDVDHDGDVDEADRELLLAAFGRAEGEPEFEYLADIDRDQWVTFVDYQLWLAAYEDFQAAQAGLPSTSTQSCGLLGLEALLVPALLAGLRRRS